MKFILSMIFLMISASTFAQHKMTAEQMMAQVDANKITWNQEMAIRSTAIAILMKIGDLKDQRVLSPQLIKGAEEAIIKDMEMQYVFYHPELVKVRYIQDGKYRYSVTFDFHTTKECVFRAEKIDFECGNPVCDPSADPSKHPNADVKGTVIPKSYCEKIYNIKIEPKGYERSSK